MNPFVLSSLISGLFSLFLFLLVCLRANRDPVSRAFIMLCIFQSYLSFVEFNLRRAPNLDGAEFWLRCFSLWPLVVSLMLHFVLTLTRRSPKSSVLQYTLVFTPALMFSALVLCVPMFQYDPILKDWGWTHDHSAPSIVERLCVIWASLCSFLAFILCWRYFREARDLRTKAQAKFTLVGIAIPVLLGTFSGIMVPFLKIEIPEMMTVAVTAECAFFGLAVWKHGLLAITPERTAGTILETITDAVFAVDSQGRIALVNESLLRMLGYKLRELLNQPLQRILRDEGKSRARRQSGIYERTSHTRTDIEASLITKDGNLVPVSMSWSPMNDEVRESRERVYVARDITERKKVDAELKEATNHLMQREKLSVLGELSASVSHEINQPLNAIGLISQSLLRDLKSYSTEEIASELKEITTFVRKTKKIIEHMGYFSRRTEDVTVQTININQVIEDALDFYYPQLKEIQVELVVELDSDIPPIMADPIRIEQVFLNLLSNARHALTQSTDETKEIRIRSQYEKATNGQPEFILVTFADNGSGMSEEQMAKAFEPFFSTKQKDMGTGLGLTIVKRILDDHRAKLNLDSTPGRGTTFNMHFRV